MDRMDTAARLPRPSVKKRDGSNEKIDNRGDFNRKDDD
jgi:hypothetical protein